MDYATELVIGLNKAIKAAGSVSALARKLNIKRQAVAQWEAIPLDRVVAVEKATGISRQELRPDLWDAEATR
jgi:DNA-binding transcriptional regulator YdaS (Cro superfamily)